jgi:uncharacterized membrane protein YhhN
LPLGLLIVGIASYTVAGALSCAVEVLLVPFRIGATLVPIAVVLAVAGNIAIPWLARRLNDSVASAVWPVAAWVIVLFVMSSTRPEGDVLLPAGGSVQVAGYGVMLGGLFSGLVTLSLFAARRRVGRTVR